MDEIEEFKRFLGPIAKDYTDAQLRQLRREMYAMAELLLDIHLYKRRRKEPRASDTRASEVLTGTEQEATIPP